MAKPRRLKKVEFLKLGPSSKQAYLKAYPKSKFRNLDKQANSVRVTKGVFLNMSPKEQTAYLSKYPKSKFRSLASPEGNKQIAQRELAKINTVIDNNAKAIKKLSSVYARRKKQIESKGISVVEQLAILKPQFSKAIANHRYRILDARKQIKEVIEKYKGK